MINSSFTKGKGDKWLDLVLLTIGLGIIYRLFLSSYALIAPDEARYCEIAREMLAHHNFIVPRLNDLLYFEKPPFFYWLQAFSIHFLGVHEWALRFWSMWFGIAGCLLTYLLGHHFYNRKTALYATLILASSFLYFGLAHYISLDMPVSILLTATFTTFLFGAFEKNAAKQRWFMWTTALLMGLTVLTKGLIGIAFPAMVIGLWVLLLNKWHELKKWHIISSLIIFIIVAAPWHIILQMQFPQFFHFYFIKQQFSRYSSFTAERYEPFYFYFVVTLLGFFPWSAFLIQAIKNSWVSWKERHNFEFEIFLFIWFFTILIFFSISKSKLIPYILPIFPPAALMTGKYFTDFEHKKTKGFIVGFIILIVIAIIMCAYMYIAPTYYPYSNPTIAMHFMIALAIILCVTLVSAGLLYWRPNLRSAFIVLFIGSLAFLITLLPAISHIDHRSTKPLVRQLLHQRKPSDKVVAYKHYYQDLPFYLNQRIIVANCSNELDFGLKYAPNASWMISESAFWKLWDSPQVIFAVTRISNYRDMLKDHSHSKFVVITKTQRNILLRNQ